MEDSQPPAVEDDVQIEILKTDREIAELDIMEAQKNGNRSLQLYHTRRLLEIRKELFQLQNPGPRDENTPMATTSSSYQPFQSPDQYSPLTKKIKKEELASQGSSQTGWDQFGTSMGTPSQSSSSAPSTASSVNRLFNTIQVSDSFNRNWDPFDSQESMTGFTDSQDIPSFQPPVKSDSNPAASVSTSSPSKKVPRKRNIRNMTKMEAQTKLEARVFKESLLGDRTHETVEAMPRQDVVILRISKKEVPQTEKSVIITEEEVEVMAEETSEWSRCFFFLRRAFKLPADSNINQIRSCLGFDEMLYHLQEKHNKGSFRYSYFIPHEDKELMNRGFGSLKFLTWSDEWRTLLLCGYDIYDETNIIDLRRKHLEYNRAPKGSKSSVETKINHTVLHLCRGKGCIKDVNGNKRSKAVAILEGTMCVSCVKDDVIPEELVYSRRVGQIDNLEILQFHEEEDGRRFMTLKIHGEYFGQPNTSAVKVRLPVVTLPVKSKAKREKTSPRFNTSKAMTAYLNFFYESEIDSTTRGSMMKFKKSPFFDALRKDVRAIQHTLAALKYACIMRYDGFNEFRIFTFGNRSHKTLPSSYFTMERSKPCQEEIFLDTIHRDFDASSFCDIEYCGSMSSNALERCTTHTYTNLYYYLMEYLSTSGFRRLVYVRFDISDAMEHWSKWSGKFSCYRGDPDGAVQKYLSTETPSLTTFPQTLKPVLEKINLSNDPHPKWVMTRQDMYDPDDKGQSEALLLTLSIIAQCNNMDPTREPIVLTNSNIRTDLLDLTRVFKSLVENGISITIDKEPKASLLTQMQWPSEPDGVDLAHHNLYTGRDPENRVVDHGITVGALDGNKAGSSYKRKTDLLLQEHRTSTDDDRRKEIEASLPMTVKRAKKLPSIRKVYYQDKLRPGESFQDEEVSNRFRDNARYAEACCQIAMLWAQHKGLRLMGGDVPMTSFNSKTAHYDKESLKFFDINFKEQFEKSIWYHCGISVTMEINLPRDPAIPTRTLISLPQFNPFEVKDEGEYRIPRLPKFKRPSLSQARREEDSTDQSADDASDSD